MTAQFISFEGIEGLGKSTNLIFVKQCLESHGIDVLCTREPGGTPVAEAIRTLLLQSHTEPMVPEVELLLMLASRLQHVERVIKPALQAGRWVLCDRFLDASLAYQGGGRGIPLPRIQTLQTWVLGDFKPHHTVLLDAPVSLSMKRIHHKKKDRIETEPLAFFERVRDQYLQLAQQEPNRFCIIDATQTLDAVQSHLAQQVMTWLS
jgi:dTMP kinase